jgi:hypothetical protein
MSGRGVSEFSLKVFMIRQRLHKMRHEWISPQELEDMTSEDDFLRETESNSARRLREEIHDVQDGYEMPNHPEGFVPDEERASTSQWGTYDGNFNQQQEGQR